MLLMQYNPACGHRGSEGPGYQEQEEKEEGASGNGGSGRGEEEEGKEIG